ncbi:MAG: tRNA preQ1(34) S-adenosylmethionine ribosyltransferase-isomerase QueA [Patescibacteria group bacterium]
MDTSLFDYHLPEDQIAQQSVEPRDQSRLLVVDRGTGQWQHKQFFEISQFLRAGDVLVLNNTKVFRARLHTEGLEVFLLRAKEGSVWEVMVRPGKKVQVDQEIDLNGLRGTIVEKRNDGIVLMRFDRSPDEVVAFANEHGEIPVPPYVNIQPQTFQDYQTVYAKETGSVAAPTAGFHFTQRLIDELKQKGIQFEEVTLHVGIGTFRPMKTETIEEHEMHSEFVSIDSGTAERINTAKKEGRRVIAVGTTTVRTLEGVAHSDGGFRAFTGDVNLFIKPGFEFEIIDVLITNFHLPKSTLLVLVSAFAGREHVMNAYAEAVKEGYRFFSFGDAMFIQ